MENLWRPRMKRRRSKHSEHNNIVQELKSSSPEAAFLRKELYGLAKKKRRIAVDNEEYELRARIYDSFGEDAFRVQLRKL